MQILKNLWYYIANLFNKKINDIRDQKSDTIEPVTESIETITPVVPITGLPIETYIPPVESKPKEVVGMSPLTITEIPPVPNELSPAEAVIVKKKKKYYKKKPKGIKPLDK